MHSSVGVVDLDAQPEISDDIRRASELLADVAQLRADLMEGDLVLEGKVAEGVLLKEKIARQREGIKVLDAKTAQLEAVQRAQVQREAQVDAEMAQIAATKRAQLDAIRAMDAREAQMDEETGEVKAKLAEMGI